MLRRAAQNRVVAIKDRFDVDVRPRLGVVGVVAHPLAERAFLPHLAGHGLALEHDLGIGGDRKTGIGPTDHVDRLAAQTAGDIVFADLPQRRRRQHEQQRVLPAHDRDLHRLATLEILVAMDAAVLALGDLAADGVAVVDLRAVGAEVEPAIVGILGDDAAGGADVARLVLLVMQRHRELQHVDLVAFEHVLQHRAVLHVTRRQRLHGLHAVVVALDDIDLAVVLKRQPERERNPLERGEVAVEGAEALRIAREFRRTGWRARCRSIFRSASG